MQPHFTFDTHSGATVEATRVGVEYDLNVRNAAGYTIASVRMDETEFRGLYSDVLDALDEDGEYERGYADGWEAAA